MNAGKIEKLTQTRGYSLVEVCISIIILTVIFASMMAVFSQGSRYLRKDRQRSVGLMLAYGMMENLTATGYVFSGDRNQTKTALAAPFQRFQSMVNVTAVPGPAGLAEINVTIFWQGEQGERNVSVNTFASNY
jgi:Tfp pilus assembly protein PilV